MKPILVLFCVISALSLQSVSGLFKHLRDLDKNDRYNLHREPIVESDEPLNTVPIIFEGWVPQRLNNFDPQDRRTFNMRFLMNMQYFRDNGPIFIFVGGEWTISPGLIRTGHIHDMTRALNGVLFYTEHRYYGQTRPVPDLTLDNLRWLNIDQALADLAHFIEDIKENIPVFRDSQVILVGCSYSATMVTWFIQKYPHLAKGAWALSGPLLAKVDFVEYKEVVSYAIREVGGPQCATRIKTAFKELEEFYKAGNTDVFNNLFFLCTPLDIDNKLDVWSIFSDIAGSWSGMVQYYDRYYRDIENACDALMSYDEPTELESYAKWIANRWRLSSTNCYDHTYESFLRDWNGTSWNDWIARSEWRQWLYQTCAEYGWYQTSGSDNILFGTMFPVEFSLQWCYDIYDGFFTPDVIHRNIDRTNVVYGALNPSVRNVYSSHGQFDPWRPMGVQEDINVYSPTTILPGESHCSDMSSIRARDTPEMVANKERIFELVQQWLGLPGNLTLGR